MKIIQASVADRPEFVRNFEHEAHAIASVEHPHVVPLYDYWREPGAVLVIRLMRGGSVDELVQAYGALSTRATIDILREIGPALEAAHRVGVVHRDVRPANLLLDDQGACYLADFGIAELTPSGGDPLASGVGYASPEVLRGGPLSAAADIHSLGLTIFELLTASRPFGGSDRAELARRHLTEPLPSDRRCAGRRGRRTARCPRAAARRSSIDRRESVPRPPGVRRA